MNEIVLALHLFFGASLLVVCSYLYLMVLGPAVNNLISHRGAVPRRFRM